MGESMGLISMDIISIGLNSSGCAYLSLKSLPAPFDVMERVASSNAQVAAWTAPANMMIDFRKCIFGVLISQYFLKCQKSEVVEAFGA